MASRQQVRELLDSGLDFTEAGKRLGIPPGQVYLIATGMAADGADAPPEEASQPAALAASQHLASPPYGNPTSSQPVLEWMAGRVAADRPMREAAAQRTAEPEPPPAEDPGNPEADQFSRDLTMVLTRQHNQARALLQQLQALPSHKTGGTAEDLAARKSIVDMITVRLTRHETAEQQYLWPTVRKALDDGDVLADEALGQEKEGTDTLARLGQLEPDSDEFDEGVEQLVAQLRKHVAYEGQVFARLREAVPDSERERLGRKIETTAGKGPTRPHRRAPTKPAASNRPADRQGKAS